MPAAFEQAVRAAAEILKQSTRAVAFTGAGISTPSGIPDFRSKTSGLWEQYNPMDVASIATFRARPERFYGWIRPLMRQSWEARPNPAHLALAQLEGAGILQGVITQNIDDLHQRAGSKTVHEIHGSMRDLACPACAFNCPAEQFREQMMAEDVMPRCPNCGRVLKPGVTLFGEMLPERAWHESETLCRNADVVLVVGSSLEVWPAAALPEIGLENGARLIIANLSPTPLDSQADVLLPFDVAESLPRIASLALAP